jgi:hypothetical protein
LEKAKAVAFKEVKLQKAMGEVVQDKMQSAESRKEALLKEAVNKISSSKKNMSPREPSGSSLTIAEIESKIKGAAERRDSFLAAIGLPRPILLRVMTTVRLARALQKARKKMRASKGSCK